ncbi:MAG: hypothetical protein CMH83_18845 [Nocardioides sp.]|nr:hypothetical protein [Nocardioides sp.]
MSTAPDRPDDAPDDDTHDLTALREERDQLLARAEEAERIAELLAEELADVRRELADREKAGGTGWFENEDDVSPGERLAPDGSDPSLLSISLAVGATVALLTTLLSVFNQGVVSLTTFLAAAITAALAWSAWSTRIVAVEVSVDGGVVTVKRGQDVHRFDLRNDATAFEVRGVPGRSDWRVRFVRRGLPPIDVDARMVDADDFMARVRRYRPEA